MRPLHREAISARSTASFLSAPQRADTPSVEADEVMQSSVPRNAAPRGPWRVATGRRACTIENKARLEQSRKRASSDDPTITSLRRETPPPPPTAPGNTGRCPAELAQRHRDVVVTSNSYKEKERKPSSRDPALNSFQHGGSEVVTSS